MAGAALVLASCAGAGGSLPAGTPGDAGGTTVSSTAAAPTITTDAPTTTTTATPTTTTTAPDPVSVVPDTPVEIGALQFELGARGFAVTDAAGEYGAGTRHAVMAFQKLHGLARDGVAGPQTLGALASAGPVEPRLGRHPHIEVDLAAQVVIVVDASGQATAVNATSGAPATPTPPGRYRVLRQVDGWDPGPWGPLYRPKYFVGGIAFHGGYPVLAAPASHGCVRLPDASVDWLWSSGAAAVGTPVDVY